MNHLRSTYSQATTAQAIPGYRQFLLTWLRKDMVGYAFLAPAYALITIFVLIPIVLALYYSFRDWDFGQVSTFVGLSNYQALLNDPLFGLALRNTVLYSLFVIIGITIVSLALALLVNTRLRFLDLFRTVYFFPAISSIAVVATIWKVIYNPTFGLLNFLLGKIGIAPQLWLVSPELALPSISVMAIWQSAGYFMVIYLAGLQNIPQDLYDAAAVDGADHWDSFWHITLPLLRPTTLFVVVVATIQSFQVFDAVYIMTGGGPAHATEVLGSLIYTTGFRYFRMGAASAMAYVLAIIIFTISVLQRRLLSVEVEY